MAVIGKQRLRITAPWVKVTLAAGGVGSSNLDPAGGSILAGETRDVVLKGKAPEIYVFSGHPYSRAGPSTTKRVVSALEGQGYRVVEHKENMWLLELADPSAPEDAGESSPVSISRPGVLQFFDWLQKKIDKRKERRH
jgi:hypothetical protein